MKSHLLNTQWQRLPKDVVLRLQGERLHRYLRDVVVPFSTHYRELFQKHGLRADSIRSVEYLEQIPFTSKADLVTLDAFTARLWLDDVMAHIDGRWIYLGK